MRFVVGSSMVALVSSSADALHRLQSLLVMMAFLFDMLAYPVLHEYRLVLIQRRVGLDRLLCERLELRSIAVLQVQLDLLQFRLSSLLEGRTI